MPTKHKISIPEPCHEKWDKMTPAENGRFCLSCSKTVIDFTTMLPEEVQHFFMANQNKSICGRFKNSQLENIIIQIPTEVLYKQTQYHRMFLLALFIAMGTTLFSCQDKNGDKQKINKIEIVEDSSKVKINTIVSGLHPKDESKDTLKQIKEYHPKKTIKKKDDQIIYDITTTGVVSIEPEVIKLEYTPPKSIDSTKTESKEN